jgi:hypothetical protein
MFPGLISEFMKAETEYRQRRSYRSFLEHPRRLRGRAHRAPAPRPTEAAERVTWSARSA